MRPNISSSFACQPQNSPPDRATVPSFFGHDLNLNSLNLNSLFVALPHPNIDAIRITQGVSKEGGKVWIRADLHLPMDGETALFRSGRGIHIAFFPDSFDACTTVSASYQDLNDAKRRIDGSIQGRTALCLGLTRYKLPSSATITFSDQEPLSAHQELSILCGLMKVSCDLSLRFEDATTVRFSWKVHITIGFFFSVDVVSDGTADFTKHFTLGLPPST